MLHIDRMRIQLPAGYEHRASRIANLVGESMAEFRTNENRNFENLTIGPLQVSANATDHDIANSVVERITSMLRREI